MRIFYLLVFVIFFNSSCTGNALSKEEVNLFIANYLKSTNQQEKVQTISDLLIYLKKTNSVEDDYMVRYAIKTLAQHYLVDEDEAILIAFDNTQIQAGFANFVCGFYKTIEESDGFIRRYKKGGVEYKAIERCIGISFKREG
jgi:hypothetical protein